MDGVSGGRSNKDNSDDKVQTDGKLFNSRMTRRFTLSPFVESMSISTATVLTQSDYTQQERRSPPKRGDLNVFLG